MIIAFLNEDQGSNIGEVFYRFLDFYGNIFDENNMGIGFGYNYNICYVQLYEVPEETKNQIIILDPFNPENNITQSCFRYQDISKLFREIVYLIRKIIYRTDMTSNFLNRIFESLKLGYVQ